MLILSNSLAQEADEGNLKLASSLVKRLKKKYPDNTFVVSFERKTSVADEHLNLNKLHLSARLISIIRKHKSSVLYIPFPAPTLAMAIRIFLISIFSRRRLSVMMVRQYPMNRVAKLLLRLSKAKMIVFSKKSYDFYFPIVKGRVLYLKSGVDTKKFISVSDKRSKELKKSMDLILRDR